MVQEFFPYSNCQTLSPENVIGSGSGVTRTQLRNHGIHITPEKGAAASHDVLVDIFERIQSFLTYLNNYSGIRLTDSLHYRHFHGGNDGNAENL
jgi:hypothetical protein